MKSVPVAYSVAELKDGMSVQSIMEGKARAIFARAGQLYVLTGAAYFGDEAEFDASVATPAEHYRGKSMTYAERSEYLYRLPHANADRIRNARRFYEGIAVRHRGAIYVLGAESERWYPMSRPPRARR